MREPQSPNQQDSRMTLTNDAPELCGICGYRNDSEKSSNLESMTNHYLQVHSYELVEIKTLNMNTAIIIQPKTCQLHSQSNG